MKSCLYRIFFIIAIICFTVSLSKGQELKLSGTIAFGNEIIGYITDMAVDEKGTIYILDNKMNQVRIIGDDGKSKVVFGQKGTGPGEFNDFMKSIDVAPDGNVIVAGMRRVFIFSNKGEYRNAFTTDFQMADIGVNEEGNILCSGYKEEKIIQVYDQEGKYLRSFGDPFTPSSEFDKYKHFPVLKLPLKTYAYKDGSLYMANPYKSEVYVVRGETSSNILKVDSKSFSPAELRESKASFSSRSMACSVLKHEEELYVSYYGIKIKSEIKAKSEVLSYKNGKLLSRQEIDGFPAAIDSLGRIYVIFNDENPRILVYSKTKG